MARSAMLPSVAIGAVALAGLSVVVPIPSPVKPVIAPPEAPKPPEPEGSSEASAVKNPESWSELTEKLAKLTDTLPEVPAQETATAEPTPDVAVAQAQQSTLPPLSWRYRGTIRGPGSTAALLITSTGSRLVFVGMRLADEHDPANPNGVLIKEISEQAVVLERQGIDVSLPFEPREPSSELGRRFAHDAAMNTITPTPQQ